MKTEIKQISETKYEVLVDVDTELWKSAQAKNLKKALANVSVPGFRKGKVPESMAMKHVDQSKVMYDSINDVIQPGYEAALDESKLIPFAQPTLDVTKVSNEEVQLKFVITVAPKVTLGEYKNLGIKKEVKKISDEEINASLNKTLEENANLIVAERPAQMGDTVVLDFEGFVDGKAFEGGKGENYELVLGSKSFIPGFEDALVGVAAGESKDVNVKFPEQYVETLAGKDATFKCVVHEVKTKELPTLNDEFVSELGIENVKTVEDLKAHEKAKLEETAKQEADKKYYNDIVKAVTNNAQAVIDEDIIKSEMEGAKENMNQQLSQNGLTLDQYLKIIGKSNEDYEKELHDSSVENVKTFVTLQEIAKAENIKVSDEDIENEYATIASRFNMEVAKVKEILGKDINRLISEIMMRKIREKLIELN